jgi:membrane protein DedA with SNARE-associated domain
VVPSPESANTWISVLKNLLLIAVGVFIIIHETVGTDIPSVVLLLVAGAALGLPILEYLSGMRGGARG